MIFLFKKKVECLYRGKKDQDIITIESNYITEAFKDFLIKKEYKIESFRLYPFKSVSFYIKIDNKDMRIDLADNLIEKRACLSCKTCLGWRITDFKRENIKLIGKDLNKYFQNIIDERVEKLRIEEKRVKLAIEICGC